MSLPWRWCLVVVIAATVLVGFIPQAVLTGSHVPDSATTLISDSVPTFPSGCSGAACGRSTPAAPTPVLTIAALLATAAVIAAAGGSGFTRRVRSRVHGLPRGIALTLFHPPRFS
jgi:hypothetical protein